MNQEKKEASQQEDDNKVKEVHQETKTKTTETTKDEKVADDAEQEGDGE